MNGYGDLLERASRRFPEAARGLDDLHDRWRRRQRNRRLAAGATALVIFLATAAALGTRLQLGGRDGEAPASLPRSDVSTILLGPADVPSSLELSDAREDEGSMTLVARGDTQVLLQRLPLVDGLTRRFRRAEPGPFAILDAFVLRFQNRAGAQQAHALLELDFRREGDVPATELSVPGLGTESIALEKTQDRAYRAPTTLYLWRRSDLVMGVIAIGSMQDRQLEELARTMDARAEREVGDG